MQTLKEEMRNNILKAAKAEFKKNGFEKSDMRTIAEKAGCTCGNCYRYFRNKEAIFDAIAPAARLTAELAASDPERFFLLAERRLSVSGLPGFLRKVGSNVVLEVIGK